MGRSELLVLTRQSLCPIHRLNAEIPSIRRSAPNEIISASVLLCETAVCFLHDHEIDTHVGIGKNTILLQT